MNARVTWFGHPKGLTVLFLTNMWEQFSYFGMRALLVYYMTKQLMFAQGQASLIYGAYTASAYFAPLIGGFIADRVLGKRRAVILGGSIMAVGHFMMTFESLLFPALATIAIGNGLFLPTLPSQVGDLYQRNDPRRASAFNVYYVGINVGGLLAPLICGTLGETLGWHYGFGAAGLGMVIGLVIYMLGQRHLPPEPARVQPPATGQHSAPYARETVFALVGVALAVVLFRGAYEQMGNTVALWADSGVDRATAFGVIPMTWVQALNPLFVIVFTPLLLAARARRVQKGERLAPRMALGALIVASAYLMLAAVTLAAPAGALVPVAWLIGFVLVLTLGELFILPTGLALFARLAPPRLGATTVASWYLTIFGGSLFAGIVGMAWTPLSHGAFFGLLAVLAIGAAVVLRALEGAVQKALDKEYVGGAPQN